MTKRIVNLAEYQYRKYRAFARLSQQEKLAFVQKLDDEEALKLLYTWEAWARDKQLTPSGNWVTWLILAGRGFGKTRTGAERIIGWAQEDVNGRFALVGRTAADVRDVMIEGESGILSCSPPWFTPRYEPSKRRLTWPNGAIATTYSADTPDQLRGPQHTKAWCLAGNTPVLMSDGTQKALADIRAGDYVMTRKGARRVTWQGMTKRNCEVYLLNTLGRQTIIGTAEHPVWVQGRGFVPISQLSEGMSLVCATHVSNLADMYGTSVDTEITTSDVSCSTDLSGSRRMAQFPKDAISTIKTATNQTIGLKTSNCSRTESIAGYMPRKSWARIGKYLWRIRLPQGNAALKNAWREPCTVRDAEKSTIVPHHTQPVSAQVSVSKPHAQERLLAKCDNANSVERSIKQKNETSITAPKSAVIAQPNSVHQQNFESLSVKSATPHLSQNDLTHGSALDHAPLLTTDTIASVEKLPNLIDVYDITVEDAHEFFAHGVLVHNCDEPAAWKFEDTWDQMMFGLRLGAKPQVVATTTPRPTRLIRALMKAKTTRVTSGTTYENKNNLSPVFWQQITTKYEGTRLGRQELEAVLLDDAEGALWKREAMIENHRVLQPPELVRVVVAVDPPASHSVESAECGIIVAGLGVDGHGYVLDDLSMQGSPNEWARQAITGFYRYHADRLVAEVNQGGDMVEAVIRGIDKTVAFKAVHATRGKQLRAEPVAAIYEQGRGHHVGTFPYVEDQMCQWVQGDESPDRLDALVWAFTELMVNEKKSGGVLSTPQKTSDDEDIEW